MRLNTHLKIDSKFSGELIELKEDCSKVLLKTKNFMVADDKGLIHGGFTFSAADFAAMAAINEPYVVLAGAKVKFLAPVVVGDEIIFEAKVLKRDTKGEVEVVGRVGEKEVFKGLFQTYSPDKHILNSS